MKCANYEKARVRNNYENTKSLKYVLECCECFEWFCRSGQVRGASGRFKKVREGQRRFEKVKESHRMYEKYRQRVETILRNRKTMKKSDNVAGR